MKGYRNFLGKGEDDEPDAEEKDGRRWRRGGFEEI